MTAVGVQLQCLFGCRLQRQPPLCSLAVGAHSGKVAVCGFGLGAVWSHEGGAPFPMPRSLRRGPSATPNPQPIIHQWQLLVWFLWIRASRAQTGNCSLVSAEPTNWDHAAVLKHSADRRPCFTSSTASSTTHANDAMAGGGAPIIIKARAATSDLQPELGFMPTLFQPPAS